MALTHLTMPISPSSTPALDGITVLSLALNLPGPAALQRLRALGASCIKFEPPGAQPDVPGDPMAQYSARAYAALHQGIQVEPIDLKTSAGQARLNAALHDSDVLLTSFRPSACAKLGLTAQRLARINPKLCWIAIVGSAGAQAEHPGHDLTYLAESDLLTGTELPATLYADMGGALMATEAVLSALLQRARTGSGVYQTIALADAAAHLAQPRQWGLMQSTSAVGGGHAGYQIYRCRDGRIALAALEPHFAKRLCGLLNLDWQGIATMFDPDTHTRVAAWAADHDGAQLEALARDHDLPLHVLPDTPIDATNGPTSKAPLNR
ncbi:MAG: CoA transferase [Rhodoferax sp.]